MTACRDADRLWTSARPDRDHAIAPQLDDTPAQAYLAVERRQCADDAVPAYHRGFDHLPG